jgi:hypothetical protein
MMLKKLLKKKGDVGLECLGLAAMDRSYYYDRMANVMANLRLYVDNPNGEYPGDYDGVNIETLREHAQISWRPESENMDIINAITIYCDPKRWDEAHLFTIAKRMCCIMSHNFLECSIRLAPGNSLNKEAAEQTNRLLLLEHGIFQIYYGLIEHWRMKFAHSV